MGELVILCEMVASSYFLTKPQLVDSLNECSTVYMCIYGHSCGRYTVDDIAFTRSCSTRVLIYLIRNVRPPLHKISVKHKVVYITPFLVNTQRNCLNLEGRRVARLYDHIQTPEMIPANMQDFLAIIYLACQSSFHIPFKNIRVKKCLN